MGISINNLNQSAGTYQSMNVGTKEQQKPKEVIKESSPENSYNAVSQHGDTLTISESGKSASMNMNNQSESEAGNEESTYDLSGYTENELKQMYLDGTITKSEYDAELDSRNE